LEDALEERLSGVGLSQAKLKVLTSLVQAGEPLALRELAARNKCVRSNVTQLVDRLEAEGLVRRIDDPNDRRSVRAEITAAGIDRQGRGELLVASQEAEFAARFSADQRKALAALLGIGG
jgi:DNA-binding MarR family transcriptional regulator